MQIQIQIQTNHSDITTNSHRLFFATFVYSYFSYYFLLLLYTMHLKQQFISARCLSHMELLRASRAETPGGQTNRGFIKQIQNIMKYHYIQMWRKIIDDYRL